MQRRAAWRSLTGPAGDRRIADYTTALKRHARLFWVLIALGAVGGVALGLLQTPVYAGTTSVLVTPTGVTDPNPGRNRAPAAVDLDTEVQLALSPAIISAAAGGISISSERMQRRLSLSVPANSRVLRFRFEGFSPAEAARGADAAAGAYLSHRRTNAEQVLRNQARRRADQLKDLRAELRQATEGLSDPEADAGELLYTQSQVQQLTRQVSNAGQRLQGLELAVITPGQVLAQAQQPSAPAGPGPARRGLEGLMAGQLAACTAIWLLGRRRRRVHGLLELASALPPGAVAFGEGRHLIGHRPQDFVAGLVRHLPDGGMLAVLAADRESPRPASFTAARAVQRGRYRALVAIWPQARTAAPEPAVGPAPGPGGEGMAELLLSPGRSPFELATLVEGVWLLPAGQNAQRAAAATGRQGARDALATLRSQVDYAFIEVLGARPYAGAVARAADGVVLVVRDHVTELQEIRRLIERVGPERVRGVHLLPAPNLEALTVRLRRRPSATVPASAGR